MIGVSTTLLISFALLLMLLLFVIRGITAAQGLPLESSDASLDEASEFPPCPSQFVARVFSLDDARFVAEMKSPQLARLFRAERQAVASVWVQQTSAAIQRTMREHKRVARMSEELEFTTELKVLLLYAEIMFICGVLFVAIQSVGPLCLRRLAVYVDAQSQHLTQVQQSFKAAASPQEFPRVGVSL
jgi:hypothetical protein